MNSLLKNVTIKYTDSINSIKNAIIDRPHLKIQDNKFFIDVYTIGKFYVENGNAVLVEPYNKDNDKSIKLMLNGPVLGAILQQQKTIALHGSSFVLNDKCITICGNSGVGKSSAVAAFCQNNGKYITDDITPINIVNGDIVVTSTNNNIKLWDDTLEKMGIPSTKLETISDEIKKYYYSPKNKIKENVKLDIIVILTIHNHSEFKTKELTGIMKYNSLRKHIYRRIFLKGMPETEKHFFKQMFIIANKVRVIHIARPQLCNIVDLKQCIENALFAL